MPRLRILSFMLFSGEHGQEVHLAIRGYERAFTYAGDYDANWLYVFLRVSSDQHKWQVEHPCLLTWELAALSNWVGAWSRNEPLARNPINFIEPNLCFERRAQADSGSVLRIGFDLECRPPGAVDGVDYYVDCPVTPDTLRQLAQDLRQLQEAFPVR